MSQARREARRILINEEAEDLALGLAVALVGQRRRVLVSRMRAGTPEEPLLLASTLARSWLSVIDLPRKDLDFHLNLASEARLHDHIFLLPAHEMRPEGNLKVGPGVMYVAIGAEALLKDWGIQALLVVLDLAENVECFTVCFNLLKMS